MTSVERVFTVLERKEPDVIPTFEWKVAPNVIEAFVPGGDYFDFVEKVGHDVVCTAPVYEKKWVNKDTFIDEFGITRCLIGPDKYPVAIDHPIKSLSDIKHYEPPPLESPLRFKKIDAAVKRFKGEKAILVNLHDVFSFPRDLRGMEQLFMDFILCPELVREVVGFSVDYNIELARLVKKHGTEIIGIGDDFADNKGPFISPKMFREFLYPEMKRVVKAYKDLGFYVIKHSDGNLMPIIDMIIETGIDCLDPIDPLAGMDIGFIKQKYGDRIAIKGNVDCVTTLQNGTPQQVEEEVRECIRRAARGGGYIISSSNSLHSGVKPELYQVMLDSIQKYGVYPIEL